MYIGTRQCRRSLPVTAAWYLQVKHIKQIWADTLGADIHKAQYKRRLRRIEVRVDCHPEGIEADHEEGEVLEDLIRGNPEEAPANSRSKTTHSQEPRVEKCNICRKINCLS